MKRITTLLSIACILASSCTSVQDSPNEYARTVTLDMMADALHPATKSSYLAHQGDESSIRSATIIASDEYGDVLKIYTESSSADLTLKPGREYTFDVFVNMGDLREVIDGHEEAVGYRHAISNESMHSNGLPMYGIGHLSMSRGTDRVTVSVDRIVARYEFRFSTAGISSGTMKVKDVQVKNIPGIVCASSFHSISESDVIIDGDHASAEDISLINNGESAFFYIPENLQGVENGIHIPSDKVPSYSFGSVNPDLCSYLEVTCSYTMDGNSTSDDIIYRMYLGANSTCDFNVRRNTQYLVTLQPTDIDPEKTWWKCEPLFEYERRLVVSPSSVNMCVGQTQAFTAHLIKTLHGNILEQSDVTLSCSWDIVSGSNVVTRSSGSTFKATSEGQAFIQASYGEWCSELVPIDVESSQKDIVIDILARQGKYTVHYGVTASNGAEQANCYSYGSSTRNVKTIRVTKGSGNDTFHVSTSTLMNQSGLDYLVYDVEIDGEHFLNSGHFQVDWSSIADERHEIIVTPVFPGTRKFTLYATPPNGLNGLSVGLSYVNNSYDAEANVEAGRGTYFLTTEANYGSTTSATKSIQVFGDKFKVSGYRVFGSTSSGIEVYVNGSKVFTGQIGSGTSTNRFETPVFEMDGDNTVVQVYLR